MAIESWVLLQAADLAEHAATHLSVAAAAVQHEAHVLLEEITHGLAGLHISGVDGGCAEHLPH